MLRSRNRSASTSRASRVDSSSPRHDDSKLVMTFASALWLCSSLSITWGNKGPNPVSLPSNRSSHRAISTWLSSTSGLRFRQTICGISRSR